MSLVKRKFNEDICPVNYKGSPECSCEGGKDHNPNMHFNHDYCKLWTDSESEVCLDPYDKEIKIQ